MTDFFGERSPLSKSLVGLQIARTDRFFDFVRHQIQPALNISKFLRGMQISIPSKVTSILPSLDGGR